MRQAIHMRFSSHTSMSHVHVCHSAMLKERECAEQNHRTELSTLQTQLEQMRTSEQCAFTVHTVVTVLTVHIHSH